MQQAIKELKDAAERGYSEISESEIWESLFSKQNLLPMDQILVVLPFEPVSIKGTPFERLHLEGGRIYPENDAMTTDEKISTSEVFVMRAFTMPNGGRVELNEHDYFTYGFEASVSFIEGVHNENVNGVPAMLYIGQSPSGNAVSVITWETTTTFYELKMEGNVRKNGQYEFLLELARSILSNTQ